MKLTVTVIPRPEGCADCLTPEQLQCIADRLCVQLPPDVKPVAFAAVPPGDKTLLWQAVGDCGDPVGRVKKWNGVTWAPISA